MSRPLYIFDLDGTLALTEHRQHLIAVEHDWRAFFAACVDDQPNIPVIRTLLELSRGAEVWVWSGRSSEVRGETLNWLRRNRIGSAIWDWPTYPASEKAFLMREAGDYTPDDELKEQWLGAMEPYDRQRLVAVFDDRDKVVAMWRRNGVACFQVAPGKF